MARRRACARPKVDEDRVITAASSTGQYLRDEGAGPSPQRANHGGGGI
jgi:hypothetical protein